MTLTTHGALGRIVPNQSGTTASARASLSWLPGDVVKLTGELA
jgi:hypothetical protein